MNIGQVLQVPGPFLQEKTNNSQYSQSSKVAEDCDINADQLVITKISARHKLQSQESGQIIPLSAAKLLRG